MFMAKMSVCSPVYLAVIIVLQYSNILLYEDLLYEALDLQV